jgi:hypothetical protein
MYLSKYTSGTILKNLYLTNNHASEGGTIYWLYDSTMNHPPVEASSVIYEGKSTMNHPPVEARSVIYEGNTAPYGVRIATNAVGVIGDSIYTVNVYDSILDPSIKLYLVGIIDLSI